MVMTGIAGLRFNTELADIGFWKKNGAPIVSDCIDVLIGVSGKIAFRCYARHARYWRVFITPKRKPGTILQNGGDVRYGQGKRAEMISGHGSVQRHADDFQRRIRTVPLEGRGRQPIHNLRTASQKCVFSLTAKMPLLMDARETGNRWHVYFKYSQGRQMVMPSNRPLMGM